MSNGIKKIPFCKSTVGADEIYEVSEVLKSGWLTTGKIAEEFESKFAEYVGGKYAIFVSSGTAALRLALKWYSTEFGLHRQPFIVPSLTFIATVGEIINSGNIPYFADVDIETFSLPDNFETNEAMLKVHLTGNNCLAKSSWLTIEDSAHRIEKNQCRNSKNITCFSFYPTKNMTTGEGGMIVTNDPKEAEWFKKARNHGINKSDKERYGQGQWKYDVELIGEKANNTDMAAAIGLVQLKKLPWMTRERNRIVGIYNRELGYNRIGNHLYPIFVKDRKKFFEKIKNSGVQFSVHFLPLHKMSCFNGKVLSCWNKLKNTEWLGEHMVSIPLYPTLEDDEIMYIIQVIKKSKCLIKL